MWNSTYDLTIPIPLYILRYLFNYSYVISFIGAIAFSMLSSLNIDIISMGVNRNLSYIINMIIIYASISATIIWFFHDEISNELSKMIKSNLPPI